MSENNISAFIRSSTLKHIRQNIFLAGILTILALMTFIGHVILSSYYQNMGISEVISFYTLFTVLVCGAGLSLWQAKKRLKYYNTLPKPPEN